MKVKRKAGVSKSGSREFVLNTVPMIQSARCAIICWLDRSLAEGEFDHELTRHEKGHTGIPKIREKRASTHSNGFGIIWL